MKDYFNYRYSDKIDFNLNHSSFLTILGNSGDFFVESLLNKNEKCNIFIEDEEYTEDNKYKMVKKMSIVLRKHLNIFVAETVRDEIIFGLESLSYSKDDITTLINGLSRRFKIEDLLLRDPESLGSSDRVKMKILSSLIIKPNILVLDNVICELDKNDKELIYDILFEYKKNGGIIINVTTDIEESLYGDRIIILNDYSLVCDGKTISVLNEEKLLKRLNLGMPFIIELCKYFMDYGMINKYYLSNDKLVGALWK